MLFTTHHVRTVELDDILESLALKYADTWQPTDSTQVDAWRPDDGIPAGEWHVAPLTAFSADMAHALGEDVEASVVIWTKM